MCPPDAAALERLRERLRRYGGGVPSPRRPAASAGAETADGIEIVRGRYAFAHRHGAVEIGASLGWVAAEHAGAAAGLVWLDTETTGLAGGTGTYAFLIGLAYLDGETLVTEQFLLRRLRSEAHLLAAVGERLAGRPHLVTFNGRRFDWPILESRFILARQRPAAPEVHTDLITPARRLWHRVLGTHRLSTLEAHVIGAPRHDDVPGWLIPGIYVGYLRSGDRTALEPVLAHNRADLLAMVALHGEVIRTLRDLERSRVPFDWEGAGMLLARRGDHARAAQCFDRAVGQATGPRDRWRALRRLSRAYRLTGAEGARRARVEAEAASWRTADLYRVHVLEEAAKIRTRAGDLAGALAAAGEALRLATRLGLSSVAARLSARVIRLGTA
ncbi:MAG TPA: ribonuclease H-like domain-containing protein [bacterium]|nr:ribonuclease H-like domain-containing protein [bacterium]